MNRLFPESLFGQTLLVVLVGLIISLAAGSWIYSLDREEAVRAVGGFAVAQRIANLARLIQETPQQSRSHLIAALSDQTFRVSLATQPPPVARGTDDTPVALAIKAFLIRQLSLNPARPPRVSASLPIGAGFMGRRPMMGRGPMMHGFSALGVFGGIRNLRVSVPLTDGQWLSVTATMPESGPLFSVQFLASMGLMAIILLVVTVWMVRRVTLPLADLASAAERLGNDLHAPPMHETGTIETRQASRAFNAMQERLRGLIENRTRMLAAISHDLRTPLTVLRLRMENVEPAPEREKMLTTIAELDSMIAATLQFVRDDAAAEPRRRTDLAALLASVVDDMADAGLPVDLAPTQPVICECQPAALKRALANLLDNAVKYGMRAHVAIHSAADKVEIVIDDEGPGIAEDKLAHVFQPFYRIEGSRSRETGGIGLGLAIALSIVQAHNGQLFLSNRPEGGLRARIRLPV